MAVEFKGDNMDNNRDVTIRRNLEQIVHSAQEALSAWENDEDPRCVMDDLLSIQDLMAMVQEQISFAAKITDQNAYKASKRLKNGI